MKATCTYGECGDDVHGHGLCEKHYRRLYDGRPLEDEHYAPTIPRGTECLVVGCDKRPFCRGWCKGHYQRWYKHGDVFADIPLRARRGKWT